MLALRYLYVLALVIWLGGVLTLGLAAPVLFETLEARLGTEGRALAGAAVGELLARFYPVAYMSAAILLTSLAIQKVLGPTPRSFGLRVGIISGMLGATLYAGIPLARQIERVQTQIEVPVSRLAEDDPRRQRFGRLHRLSTVLMAATAAAGLVLLYWEARE